jgi:hypothetical protein
VNLLDDAINRAKSKSAKGRERRKSNFYNSPANSDKLIRLFGASFREHEYGEPPPVTKKVRGMLNGFIKVSRSSGWPERKIYNSILLLVKHWEYVKKCDHHTLNGKKAALGDRPSLLEFVICRETMLNAIDRATRQRIEVDIKERKTVEVTKGKRFVPTEEEMQEEYNRLMEDL